MDASRAVVNQLDHVVARVDDPRAVFDAFTETLGLPVARPLASYPAFESGGVALGLERVREVVVGVRDFRKARALWSKLYAPAPEVSPGVWEIDDGPSLRLVGPDSNSIQSLALSVSSLERAETHLRERGMISTVTGDELTVNPANLEELLVRLVQQEGGGYEGSRGH